MDEEEVQGREYNVGKTCRKGLKKSVLVWEDEDTRISCLSRCQDVYVTFIEDRV